jgi:hypothetical protein
LGMFSVCFDVTDNQTFFFAFVRYWTKMKYNRTIHKLFIEFKKVYDSFSREIFT